MSLELETGPKAPSEHELKIKPHDKPISFHPPHSKLINPL